MPGIDQASGNTGRNSMDCFSPHQPDTPYSEADRKHRANIRWQIITYHEEVVRREGRFRVMVGEVGLVVFEPGWAGRHLSRGLNAGGSRP